MKRIPLALATVAMAGCGNGDLADLERLVAQRADGAVAKAPPATAAGDETPRRYAYGAARRRSPFEPAAAPVDAGAGRGPDGNRERGALEQFPLGELRMVGVLRGRGAASALIRDPTGGVRALAAGGYLGTDHGRVVDVRDDRVDLVEIVRDGAGGWLQRPRSLTLTKAAEQVSAER